MEYIYRKMSLNYASLLHVLSPSSLLPNSSRLERRLDNDLITSARRADVSLLARPTHACTCCCKFPGNQGRGQPVWSRAAATILIMSATEFLPIKCTYQRCIDYVDISWRSAARGRHTREGGETSYFPAKCVNISKTVRDTSKVTINEL